MMDAMYVKNRNYKQVEILRQKNMREQRRFSDEIYGKQGLVAAHQYEIKAMAFEQRKLQKELMKIKNSSPTTWGKLPQRDGSEKEVNKYLKKGFRTSDLDRSTQKPAQKIPFTSGQQQPVKFSVVATQNTGNIHDLASPSKPQGSLPNLTKKTSGGSGYTQGTNHNERKYQNTSNDLQKEKVSASLSSLNVDEARGKVLNRLSPRNEVQKDFTVLVQTKDYHSKLPKRPSPARQHQTLSPIQDSVENEELEPAMRTVARVSMKVNDAVAKFRKGTKANNPKLSEEEKKRMEHLYRYNPDGSLRTMHTMPDFSQSVAEAKKARYIRHKEKQSYETELSVREIFE